METTEKTPTTATTTQNASTTSQNYFDLTGKVALVTGASSGLGRRFAKVLASQGADVALCARRREKLEALRDEITSTYHTRAQAYPLDVSDTDAINRVVDEIVNDFGTIDILVNNAGTSCAAPALEMKKTDWLRVIDTNMNSVFYMSQKVGRVMANQRYGRIINMASVHASVTMKTENISGDQLIAYVTAKHGVKGITIALAAGWAQYGITVNAIAPGYFDSEMTHAMLQAEGFKQTIHAMTPMDRPGQEGELDTALLYLASDKSSYTTGQVLGVDGGWTTL